MEKNYYDILEISKNASSEIVEKAYKTLVKKYHPDLQEENLKQEYENKLKLINEAYEVLSDEQKRNQYNLELQEKENLNNQNTHQNPEKYIYHDIGEKVKQARQQAEEQRKYEQEYNTKINNAINKAYHDAYIQDLKNRGYKIKYKKTFKDYLKDFISIIIFLVILVILWHVPFVKKYLIALYNENMIIHYIVDIILNIFKT